MKTIRVTVDLKTIDVEAKTCVGCNKLKPIRDFYLLREGQLGRVGYTENLCKMCDRAKHSIRTAEGHMASSGRYCPACCGLPWRVDGGECKACGLKHSEELVSLPF